MKRQKQTHDSIKYTRKISPKLGLLGFLGFLGFFGFLPSALKITDVILPFPFFFFAFFGFFGFYYEGKMSGTMRDERFEANAYRASSIANKTALSLIILTAILSISIFRITDAYVFVSILIAVIGLGFGIGTFLGQYLLYRFENGE